MSKFDVRYKAGCGPPGSKDKVEVEAAMFQTVGNFVDFFEKSVAVTGGKTAPRGAVIFRIAEDTLADVKLIGD